MPKQNRKIEFIPNHVPMKCWGCSGTGIIKKKGKILECSTCEGTGIYIEKHYYAILTLENGKKISFDVDSIK